MKSAPLPSVVFAVWVLLFAQNTRAASSVTAFDGTWSVTINAHEYKNADGTVSLAWVRHFPAKVKNGILHGEAETIVLEDKYRVILTTPDVQIPAEYTISREALRKKVFEFRDAIDSRRPEAEIKALANELYQILFGPIAKNIESYQPKTLVWSLDDVLRYVPMAALYDGSQAQLDLLLQTNGEYSHPFYWAPFVIIGNWQ
jgi:CHAT domain-containing protein